MTTNAMRCWPIAIAMGTAACGARVSLGDLGSDSPSSSSSTASGSMGAAGAGPGSSTSAGAGGGNSGGGGGGSMFDMCVVSTLQTGPMHTCQQAACHGGSMDSAMLSAKLNLENVNLTMNAKAMYLDVPNVGDPTGSPTPCAPGVAKLIDSADPKNSLIYRKIVPTGEASMPPCGSKMPFVGNITTDEKACILRWIESVIAAN